MSDLVGNPEDRFSRVEAHIWPDAIAALVMCLDWQASRPTIEFRLENYAKTKVQISCAVTAQLISAFVFTRGIPLLPKSEISSF